MTIDVIADLVNKFGIGIALIMLFIFLFFLQRKESQDTIKKKDAELKEMAEKVMQLQEKAINSTNSLVNAININTEVTRRVDTHLEKSLETQQTLVNNVYQVLNSVKK